MLPNCSHLLTDFRTVLVFALGAFLPMKVFFSTLNWNFNGKMAKNHFLAIKSRFRIGKVLEQKQKQL